MREQKWIEDERNREKVGKESERVRTLIAMVSQSHDSLLRTFKRIIA